jgi:hypothetical protein
MVDEYSVSQEPEKKNTIGWGTLGAVTATVVAVASVFNISDIIPDFSDVSNYIDVAPQEQQAFDSLGGFREGRNEFQQFGDDVARSTDRAAGDLSETLSGIQQKTAEGITEAGEGIQELGKTAFGVGDPQELQERLNQAISVVSPQTDVPEIREFLAGDASAMKWGDGLLVKTQYGVLELSPEILNIDPRYAGGFNPFDNQTFDGLTPDEFKAIQTFFQEHASPSPALTAGVKEEDLEQLYEKLARVGIFAAVGGLTARVAGDEIAKEIANEEAVHHHAQLAEQPATRVMNPHLMGMVVNAENVNKAFATVR